MKQRLLKLNDKNLEHVMGGFKYYRQGRKSYLEYDNDQEKRFILLNMRQISDRCVELGEKGLSVDIVDVLKSFLEKSEFKNTYRMR